MCFRQKCFEASAHSLAEEREPEKPPNVAQIDEVNTVVVGETLNSPKKVMSILQSAPMGAENFGVRLGDEDRDVTIA